jgi:hypothetical protein
MNSVRTSPKSAWSKAPVPVHPRVVPRAMPARPRWGYLYLAVVVVGALGTAAHWTVHEQWMETAVDGGLGFAVFSVMAGWVRINRLSGNTVRLAHPTLPAR